MPHSALLALNGHFVRDADCACMLPWCMPLPATVKHACMHLFPQGMYDVPGEGQTVGFWTELKLHSRQKDWMLALTRRPECMKPRAQDLDKWCTTDLFMSQVPLTAAAA